MLSHFLLEPSCLSRLSLILPYTLSPGTALSEYLGREEGSQTDPSPDKVKERLGASLSVRCTWSTGLPPDSWEDGRSGSPLGG